MYKNLFFLILTIEKNCTKDFFVVVILNVCNIIDYCYEQL